MNYAAIKDCDIANGSGIRISLFVSGCTHACRGCFNREAWDFSYGNKFTEKTQEYLLQLLEPDYVQGLTLLGGEPMEPVNQKELLPVLQEVKRHYPQKNIWCYTGYLFEKDLISWSKKEEITKELLNLIDVIVDGPFVEKEKDISLRFRGSANQRIIDVKMSLIQGCTVLWQG